MELLIYALLLISSLAAIVHFLSPFQRRPRHHRQSYAPNGSRPFVQFQGLSSTEKYQRSLERYLRRPLTQPEIGRAYERQVGFVLENLGYDVTFNGATQGLNDLGRDLIAKKGSETLIVQTKYWARHKTIHANVVLQLHGTTLYYQKENPGSEPIAVLFTTANFSHEAEKAAETLGVRLEILEFTKNYPMIKCNINESGAKIYHLPFDEYYDRVKIKAHLGEFYAKTVKEAEDAGFRHARRYYRKTG